jgi:hypothetical protein
MTSPNVRFSLQRVFKCPLITALTFGRKGNVKPMVKKRNPSHCIIKNWPSLLTQPLSLFTKISPPLCDSCESSPGVCLTELKWQKAYSNSYEIKFKNFLSHRNTMKIKYFNEVLWQIDFHEPDRRNVVCSLLTATLFYSLNWKSIVSVF